MKKKLLTLIAVLTLCVSTVFGLTACGDKPSDPVLFGKEVVRLSSQQKILEELDKGGCDVGVMDSVMASYYAGTNNAYSVLSEDFYLSSEDYVIAAKKGSKQLVSELNKSLLKLKTTDVATIAGNFDLTDNITLNTENPLNGTYTDGSFDRIKSRKKIIIGYTKFQPIAFEDKNAKDGLTGFDIELARAVVDDWNSKLSDADKIEIEFFFMNDWSKKEVFLENGTIDLAWNGLSWTEQRNQEMELSIGYMVNNQVVICLTSNVNKYNTLPNFLKNTKNAVVAVEAGSFADSILAMEE